MKLICKICGRWDDTHRISPDQAIATVDEAKLALPLSPDMFTSVMPERGIPAPWMPGVGWDRMFCPRGPHLPWGVAQSDTPEAMKAGGPIEILTDEGIIKLNAKPKPKLKPVSLPPINVEPLPLKTANDGWVPPELKPRKKKKNAKR